MVIRNKTTTMFCFDVSIYDPVHDVNMITSIKTVSGNLFCIIDARKTAKYSFQGITYISEKNFQRLLAKLTKSSHRALGDTQEKYYNVAKTK